MFYHVRGELIALENGFAVVECGGVGYKATVSANTLAAISEKRGAEVRLFTHLAVREDGIELFGFASEDELSAFRLLTTVSGIGPKVALGVLSGMTPDRLFTAIVAEDVKALAKAPNVGKKTAARIILELKDKLPVIGTALSFAASESQAPVPAALSGTLADAADALSVLGYGRTEIHSAIAQIPTEGKTLEQIIAAALRQFAK